MIKFFIVLILLSLVILYLGTTDGYFAIENKYFQFDWTAKRAIQNKCKFEKKIINYFKKENK